MTALEQLVYDPLPLIVDGKQYLLSYPFTSVAEAEIKIGRSLQHAPDWFALQTKELPEVLRAGLLRFHPEEAEAVANAICSTLGPEQIKPVIDGLCALNFPEAMRKYKEVLADLLGKASRGEPLPKAWSVAAA